MTLDNRRALEPRRRYPAAMMAAARWLDGMTHRRAVVACLCLLSMLFPIAGRADEAIDPRVRYRIEAVRPATTGVSAQITPPVVAHLSPQIMLTNATNAQLVVLDSTGSPMLRVDRTGVYVNDRSSEARAALNPGAPGSSPAAQGASPGTGLQPSWRKIATSIRVRWYERRALYQGHAPPDLRKRTSLKSFVIPLRLGSAPLAISGVVEWKPILGSVRPSIVSVTPRIEGVAASVLPGPLPAIQLRNDSPRTIEITGRDGQPFARVGPRGVDANINSPTYRDTRSLPPSSKKAPEWKHQQDGPVLIWLEKRAAYPGEPSDIIQASKRQTLLGRWTIPGRIDGAMPLLIQGQNSWIPIAPVGSKADRAGGVGTSPAVGIAAGFGAAALLGAGLALRRRAKSR